MRVTDDAIPHGMKGYRPPYECRCSVCRRAWADYIAERRAAKKAAGTDELAKKRQTRTRTTKSKPAAKKRTESRDSVIGPMQSAVIAELEGLPDVKATQLVAAKSLASVIDSLTAQGTGVGAAVVNSSMKQLMAIMSSARGDDKQTKATGRRKSGGRLATVGSMTKVKRAQ